MDILFLSLIIIACVLLVLIVLVQNSKGGGLASNFASGNQFGGVVQTNKFLERATWVLAVSILVLSLLASLVIPKTGGNERESIIKEQVNAVDFNTVPNVPSKTQVEEQKKTDGTQNPINK